MARVKWARARFEDKAHAIILGDLVILCGKGLAETFPALMRTDTAESRETLRRMACEDCAAIITEAAEALGVGSHV